MKYFEICFVFDTSNKEKKRFFSVTELHRKFTVVQERPLLDIIVNSDA